MCEPRRNLEAAILHRLAKNPRSSVWTPRDLFDLGSRAAIDQALHRMARAGDMRRIARGLYDRPLLNSPKDTLPDPDLHSVIEALARREQARMKIDGAATVPTRIIVRTDARLKRLELGDVTIEFRITVPSKLQ